MSLLQIFPLRAQDTHLTDFRVIEHALHLLANRQLAVGVLTLRGMQQRLHTPAITITALISSLNHQMIARNESAATVRSDSIIIFTKPEPGLITYQEARSAANLPLQADFPLLFW